MKQITNWKVVYVDEIGHEGIGILLPGCVIKGTLAINGLETDIEVTVADVDITNLIITSIQGEKYLLKDTSRQYLQDIKKCIEIGLKEREGEER